MSKPICERCTELRKLCTEQPFSEGQDVVPTGRSGVETATTQVSKPSDPGIASVNRFNPLQPPIRTEARCWRHWRIMYPTGGVSFDPALSDCRTGEGYTCTATYDPASCIHANDYSREFVQFGHGSAYWVEDRFNGRHYEEAQAEFTFDRAIPDTMTKVWWKINIDAGSSYRFPDDAQAIRLAVIRYHQHDEHQAPLFDQALSRMGDWNLNAQANPGYVHPWTTSEKYVVEPGDLVRFAFVSWHSGSGQLPLGTQRHVFNMFEFRVYLE